MEKTILNWDNYHKGRFKSLEIIFQDLFIEDIQRFTKKDILSITPSNKKCLVLAFWNLLKQEENENENENFLPFQIITPIIDNSLEVKDEGVLFKRNKLLPDRLHYCEDSQRKSISNFINEEFNAYSQKKLEKITFVDFSHNNLNGHSLEIVFHAMKNLKNLKYLDLSNNDFLPSSSWKFIIGIINENKYLYVNIILNNSLTSKDSTKYFEIMSVDQLKRIIWVPENWIETPGWIRCLGTRSEEEINSLKEGYRFFYECFSLKLPKFMNKY